jgi:hypothetical protein
MTVRGRTRLLPAGTTVVLALGFAGACAFSACSLLNSYDEVPDGGGGAASTTPTSSGTGGHTGGHTTTSTSSGPPCTADLQGALGTTPACESCAWDHCCAEAEAFLANQAAETWQSLSDCAFGAAMNGGPCLNECLFSACGGAISFPFYAGCNNCHDSHCCTALTACLSDPACANCLSTQDSTCCTTNTLYAAWNQCLAGPCQGFCDQYAACG